jgi:methylase of polypeptide subunit release factors
MRGGAHVLPIRVLGGLPSLGDAATDPPFVEKITSMFVREEQDRDPPFGRALDIGTGSAIWAVELPKRGWAVTGVELVEKALDRARARVKTAGAR